MKLFTEMGKYLQLKKCRILTANYTDTKCMFLILVPYLYCDCNNHDCEDQSSKSPVSKHLNKKNKLLC
jgi:hypothetical protein